MNVEPKQKNKKTLRYLILVALCMFGFAYVLIPFYSVFCKVTGLNGKTSSMVYHDQEKIDYERTIQVQFIANNNSELPWKFHPKVFELKVHPGQVNETAFFAENLTDKPMTVQAIPSVSPGVAANHLKKLECFCFERQTLNGHESKEMPLRFTLSNDIPLNIRTLTLSYTLFDVEKPALKE